MSGDRYLWSSKYPSFAFCFRELLFASRADEIAVLREFSDALVRNLFPEALTAHEVNRCALNEIVALKGKKALNSLSYIRDKPPMTSFTSVNCM